MPVKNVAGGGAYMTLNESPSEKEGKCDAWLITRATDESLNESPSEKEGKFRSSDAFHAFMRPSMKVPPKRKGNQIQNLKGSS